MRKDITMTKKQILTLALAFLLGACLAERVAAQSQIHGPGQTQPGTLVTFEITPPQIADWTITSVETTEKVFQTDTSTNRLYFATPQTGTYHIVAAIVVDGKPRLITKTLVNGNDGEIKPPPTPPVIPDQPLQQWIQTQMSLLVKSQHRDSESRLVAGCFEQIVQKIENGTIKTAQNARAQLQIALTGTLAMASDTAMDDWHEFLTQLSQQMANELDERVNDIKEVKKIFQTVADAMLSLEPSEKIPIPPSFKPNTQGVCPECQRTMNSRSFRLFR
jgi:hypothetical protein